MGHDDPGVIKGLPKKARSLFEFIGVMIPKG